MEPADIPEYDRNFSELYTKKLPEYIRYAESILHDALGDRISGTHDKAKDLVQDTFSDLYRNKNIDFSRNRDEIGTYCTKAVLSHVNEYITKDFLRLGIAKPRIIPEAAYGPLSDAENIPSPIKKTDISKLMELIQSVDIPRLQKDILLGYYIEGRTDEELAKEFGKTDRRTIFERRKAALRKLKEDPEFIKLMAGLKS